VVWAKCIALAMTVSLDGTVLVPRTTNTADLMLLENSK
jgi:hypothetical protein